MIVFSEASINKIVLHKVGNHSNEEGVVESDKFLELDDELQNLLMPYFTKSFGDNDSHKFTHEADVNLNELYTYSSKIFESSDLLLNESKNILKHLYAQSTHPHIKSGELYVVSFSDVILEGELVEAIGIFKSERKDNFLQFEDLDSEVLVKAQLGVSLGKIDKAALIFNTEKEDGYRVFTVDNNNYDAQYWVEDFLNIKIDENDTYQTKKVMEMVKDFSQEIIGKKEDKKEQALFLNKAVNYFEKQESFDMEEFAEEVILEPKYKEEFKNYKKVFQEKKGTETEDTFDIVPQVVKKEKRKIKSLIKLDSNIQIRLDFKDPESGEKFIERGFDPEKDMFYYKIYFNKETN